MLSLSYAVTEFLLFICSEDFFLLCFYVLYMSAALHVTVCPFFFYLWNDSVTEPSWWWSQRQVRCVCFFLILTGCKSFFFFFCQMLHFQVLLSTVVFWAQSCSLLSSVGEKSEKHKKWWNKAEIFSNNYKNQLKKINLNWVVSVTYMQRSHCSSMSCDQLYLQKCCLFQKFQINLTFMRTILYFCTFCSRIWPQVNSMLHFPVFCIIISLPLLMLLFEKQV